MEQIYTIPVNEAFEASAADAKCGCPLCALFAKLENDELDLILGASMMEPDVRIQTNKQGFCRTHYDMMFVRKNRLGMALTLESHINELKKEIKGGGLFSSPGSAALGRIGELEKSCYICRRIDFNFEHMIETAVSLWDSDEDFRKKLASQPYFCLPHYRALLEYAKARLGKKRFAEFEAAISPIVNAYIEKLGEDVSWFCKKFDYRYDEEPWYDSKDAVERAMKFLRGDLHRAPEKKK
jgi:hypothetical protein